MVAAIALKNIPSEDILEKCIERAVGDEVDPDGGLTHQDLYFRQVSKINRGLQQINIYSEEIANSAQNPVEIAETIRKCNEILLVSLKRFISRTLLQ